VGLEPAGLLVKWNSAQKFALLKEAITRSHREKATDRRMKAHGRKKLGPRACGAEDLGRCIATCIAVAILKGPADFL